MLTPIPTNPREGISGMGGTTELIGGPFHSEQVMISATNTGRIEIKRSQGRGNPPLIGVYVRQCTGRWTYDDAATKIIEAGGHGPRTAMPSEVEPLGEFKGDQHRLSNRKGGSL